jgi:hypothetical protein
MRTRPVFSFPVFSNFPFPIPAHPSCNTFSHFRVQANKITGGGLFIYLDRTETEHSSSVSLSPGQFEET